MNSSEIALRLGRQVTTESDGEVRTMTFRISPGQFQEYFGGSNGTLHEWIKDTSVACGLVVDVFNQDRNGIVVVLTKEMYAF